MMTSQERTARQRDTRDTSVCLQGLDKAHRVDLGLELLTLAREPGQAFTRYDIAAWAGCTDSLIYLVEQSALRKLANALKFGRARSLGNELADKQSIAGANAAEMRRIVARTWTNNARGPLGVPESVVRAWYEHYLQSGSLQATAAEFGRTKQNLSYLFHRRGLPLKRRGGNNRKAA